MPFFIILKKSILSKANHTVKYSRAMILTVPGVEKRACHPGEGRAPSFLRYKASEV